MSRSLKRSNSGSFPDSAIQCFSVAVTSDEEGNYEDALDMYRAGIEIVLEELRNTIDNDLKNNLGRKVQRYLERAEEVKKIINDQNNEKAEKKKKASLFQRKKKEKKQKKTNNNKSERKPDHYNYGAQTRKRMDKKNIPHIAQRKKEIKLNNYNPTKKKETEKKQEKLSDLEETILTEMMESSPGVGWNDIVGLEVAKQTLQESIIYPNLNPELFTGLRSPPKGVLLFGPPGTGKTMLAKAVASESGFTFFNISASSLMSKYLGEGEKLMRTLFALAKKMQPSVIFMDEIDALLSARRENEHEASRRLKTEFMIQLDGAKSSSEDRILVMGATNRPGELDEAVLRRLVKKIYIPLPDARARSHLITMLLRKQAVDNRLPLTEDEITEIVARTQHYSCSDLKALCTEAVMQPIREIKGDIRKIKSEDIRNVRVTDFEIALSRIRPSVSLQSLQSYHEWNNEHGSL